MICKVNDHVHVLSFFFFNDTATTEIYTLSLHDALPICAAVRAGPGGHGGGGCLPAAEPGIGRSEEHTSELQSRQYIVCRLLLVKKKKQHRCFILIRNEYQGSSYNDERRKISSAR